MYDSWLKHESAYGGNNTTLERKNWSDDYTPENCVWATQIEQQNNKRNTIYVLYNGEKQTLKNVCRSLNISYETVRRRIMRGYTEEEAFSNGLWVRRHKQ